MSTARDLLTGSLRLIGVVATGEVPAASEAADGLVVFNEMLGAFSNEGLLIPNRVREEFTLATSTQSRTMGPSGNFNTTRPISIEQIMIEDQSSTDTPEYSVELLTSAEWAAIQNKSLTGIFPTKAYVEGTYPLETINFWPIPTAANKAVIYSQKNLTSVASLSTSVSLPPGYDPLIRYNLAIWLAPEYGKQASPTIISVAASLKVGIKNKNFKPSFLEVDDALRKGRPFNIFTGE